MEPQAKKVTVHTPTVVAHFYVDELLPHDRSRRMMGGYAIKCCTSRTRTAGRKSSTTKTVCNRVTMGDWAVIHSAVNPLHHDVAVSHRCQRILVMVQASHYHKVCAASAEEDRREMKANIRKLFRNVAGMVESDQLKRKQAQEKQRQEDLRVQQEKAIRQAEERNKQIYCRPLLTSMCSKIDPQRKFRKPVKVGKNQYKVIHTTSRALVQ